MNPRPLALAFAALLLAGGAFAHPGPGEGFLQFAEEPGPLAVGVAASKGASPRVAVHSEPVRIAAHDLAMIDASVLQADRLAIAPPPSQAPDPLDDPTVVPLSVLRFGIEDQGRGESGPLSAGALQGPARTAETGVGVEASSSAGPVHHDLWDRLRAGFALPDIDDDRVRHWEAFYLGKPDYLARIVERGSRYLFHVVEEVEARGMPLEIALLPMIESAYNPVALSRANAMGMWQFIPDTGRRYGMVQNWWFDARRDVVAATSGALDYLGKLHGDFGDWQLALAAYNCGEGCVAKAVERNAQRGKPTDYDSLVLPAETRNYLPKLQAVKNIVRDPQARGVALARIANAPYLASVTLERRIDVSAAARLAGLSEEEFRALNPAHNRPVIGGADEHTILLPLDRVPAFTAGLETASQPLLTWQPYKLKPGERLEKVAAHFGLSLAALREANGIGPRHRVAAGHTLLVPARRGEADPERLDNAVFREPPMQTARRAGGKKKSTAKAGVATSKGAAAKASPAARDAVGGSAASRGKAAASASAKPSAPARKTVTRTAENPAGDAHGSRSVPAS